MIGLIRRSAIVAGATAVALAAGVTPAVADLEDYLAAAAAAEYSGRRVVITNFDGETRAGVFDVTHVSDMTVVGAGDGGSMVAPGRVSGDAGVMVPVWSRYSTNDRYTTTDAAQTVRLGRVADVIEIHEDGRVRARFTFESLTGIPLVSEIFDGDGGLFRYSAMLEFESKPDLSYEAMEAMGESYDVMLPVETSSLPAEAAGYVRADTYAGPDETVQAFFTDGLFSFSLFEIDAAAQLDRFEDAPAIELAGSTYKRLVTPTDVWVSWESGDVAYVLIGDLPPDHLEQVLDELPEPKSKGLLSRLWRGLFG